MSQVLASLGVGWGRVGCRRMLWPAAGPLDRNIVTLENGQPSLF